MKDLIPIMIFAIPILGIVHSMMTKAAAARLEEARIRAGIGFEGHVEDLRTEIDQVRAELSEVHERLDFTERLLAKARDESA